MRSRVRTRLVLLVVLVVSVGGGWAWWKAEDSGWLYHRQLEGVTGVAAAGRWRDGAWVQLQPDLDQDDVRAALAGVAEAATDQGSLAVAPAGTPADAEGVPVSYLELGRSPELDDLPAVLEALAGLTSGPDVENASARDLGQGLVLEVSADGGPTDLPVVAGVIAEAVGSAGADQVTTAVVSVGIDGDAGMLRASCAAGLAGVADRLTTLTRAQRPGWLVGTVVDCEDGPIRTEFLVQDPEDLAPQRRRAAEVLPARWPLSVAWNGATVTGRAGLGLDPGPVLAGLRERDGATLGPVRADLSRIELAVPDVATLGRVLRRLEEAGAGRLEASLGPMRVDAPISRIGARLSDLRRLERLGWHPGYTVLRDGSEVWSAAEGEADLSDPADREGLVVAWRDLAGPGSTRFLLERPDDDDLVLPLLVFDSTPDGTAEVEPDLTVLQDDDSEEVREAFLDAWDATAGPSDPG